MNPELVVAIMAKANEKQAQYGPYPREVLRGASLVAVEAYEALEAAVIFTSPTRGGTLQGLQDIRNEIIDTMAACAMYYENITRELEVACKAKLSR